MSAQPAYEYSNQPNAVAKEVGPYGLVYSEAEYLAFDDAADGRWEFMDGRIVPVGAPEMANQLDPSFRAGASPNHYELSRILAGLLFNRLPQSCRAYTSDARTYTPLSKTYSYPDLVVICGEPQYHNPASKSPSLTNPLLIIEIVSDSTGEYDRSGKFMRYISIASLKQYLLVDSRRMQVDLFTRLPDATWNYWPATMPEQVIDLHSVGCKISLVELYANIAVPTTPPPLED